jgi:hypothetical protein
MRKINVALGSAPETVNNLYPLFHARGLSQVTLQVVDGSPPPSSITHLVILEWQTTPVSHDDHAWKWGREAQIVL